MRAALLAQGALTPAETRLVRLIDVPDVSWPFALVALLVAFGVGVVHALTPGHGKAITAAYLVGARGRPLDAVLLGAVVSAMHTASVLVLGLLLFALTRAPGVAGQDGTERLFPFMALASGLLVLLVGAGLVVRHVRAWRAGAPGGTHAHGHGDEHGDQHGHQHGHQHADQHGDQHGHQHGHQHGRARESPLSRRGLVLLGMSGGLLPSPSAFLVLATGLFSGRLAFALLLVAAFSVGLAVSLATVGLAVLHGHRLVDRLVQRGARTRPRLARVAAVVPLASALVVLAGGMWLTITAARQLGAL